MTTIVPQPYSVDFARPLGAMEHFLSLIDQHRPLHFAMAAQIEGPTAIPAWRTALDKLQERHPLLSVAIGTDADRAPYFRTVRDVPIPLRVIPGPTVSNWEAEVARELATPFALGQAPLARAVLMHGPFESVFILATHHSIADGLSSTYAIRDVLRALTGETLKFLPLVPAQESLVYMSRQATDDTNRSLQPQAPDEEPLMTFLSNDGLLPSVEALSLTPEMTQTLIERARNERTTVHGALAPLLCSLAASPRATGIILPCA
jgi:Condensation domain